MASLTRPPAPDMSKRKPDSAVRRQALEAFCRAQKLPAGSYRSDLRQLAFGSLGLHRKSIRANVTDSHASLRAGGCPSYHLANIRFVNAPLSGPVTVARHTGAARAAQVLVPSKIGMVLAHPSYAEAFGTVLIHAQRLSGVRNGLDLSSLRSSCSAR